MNSPPAPIYGRFRPALHCGAFFRMMGNLVPVRESLVMGLIAPVAPYRNLASPTSACKEAH